MIELPDAVKPKDSDSDMNDEDNRLVLMRKRFTAAVSAHSHNRNVQLTDLKFMAGSPDNNYQWPEYAVRTRGANGTTFNRPMLTINKLPQHVKQVTNDQRQNRPSVKVVPVDDKGDVELAKVFNGIIRYIEHRSSADVAYDSACENQLVIGEGYIRIRTEYADEASFDQEIKIDRVRNSFSVYMDPNIDDPTGLDARWCFISSSIPRDEFKKRYPDQEDYFYFSQSGINDPDRMYWGDQEQVRIAEYFYIEEKPDTLCDYGNGQVFLKSSDEAKQAAQQFGKPVRERRTINRKIKWCLTNGYKILEETEWAGKYIPVVRVVGNEFEIDGKVHVSGLVRNSKDAQRMYNYWASQEAEMLALAPKAPFIGYSGQFDAFRHKWETANTNNWPYLEVSADAKDGTGATLPLPQRSAPPQAQIGLIEAKKGAAEDMKNTTGQYNASLGMTSNERSGKAILARQKEGDTGTFHYVDNFARAIRAVGKQLVDLIPKIYDTNRVMRIIGEDGETDLAEIDPTQQQGVTPVQDPNNPEIVIKKIYNLTVGQFDLIVTTGPGYATKRQEALESMAQLLQGNPQLWMIAGDLFVKNMDWPGASDMAERLKRSMDPKLLQGDDKSPEFQAAQQQIEQMGQQMQQMQQMLQGFGKSLEVEKLKIQAYDAETKRISAIAGGFDEQQVKALALETMKEVLQMGDLSIQSQMQQGMPQGQPTDPSQQGMPQGQPADPSQPMPQQPSGPMEGSQ